MPGSADRDRAGRGARQRKKRSAIEQDAPELLTARSSEQAILPSSNLAYASGPCMRYHSFSTPPLAFWVSAPKPQLEKNWTRIQREWDKVGIEPQLKCF